MELYLSCFFIGSDLLKPFVNCMLHDEFPFFYNLNGFVKAEEIENAKYFCVVFVHLTTLHQLRWRRKLRCTEK